MIATSLLLAAAAYASGAQVIAVASARVVRGERISLEAPAASPDRMLRQTARKFAADGAPIRIQLVEFQ